MRAALLQVTLLAVAASAAVGQLCSGHSTLSATSNAMTFSDGSLPSANYANNMNCQWTITAQPGRQIELTFQAFNLETANSCQYDYLEVYDGSSSSAALIGRYCGASVPAPITSTGNTLFVLFRTDGSVVRTGFTLSYVAVGTWLDHRARELGQQAVLLRCSSFVPVSLTSCCARGRAAGGSGLCGGTLSLTANNEPAVLLISDGSASGQNYENNMECTWHISAPSSSQTLVLAFAAMDLEGATTATGGGCIYDYVRVHDGPHTSAPVAGLFCGTERPAPLFSTGNTVTVYFRTDASVVRNGFRLFVAANQPCSGHQVLPSRGIITDGSGPGGMVPGQHCQWQFAAGSHQRVHLEMHSVSVPCSGGAGANMGVVVYSQSSATSAMVSQWCGNQQPGLASARVNRNSLMELRTPNLFTGTYDGFVAVYEFGACARSCVNACVCATTPASCAHACDRV